MADAKPDKRPRGRPPTFGGRRVQVYLDAESVSKARQIGGGNVSRGIRSAIAQAAKLSNRR